MLETGAVACFASDIGQAWRGLLANETAFFTVTSGMTLIALLNFPFFELWLHHFY